MGYKQWGSMLIRNYTKTPLNVRNARLDWGKFYQYPNKAIEIKPTDLEKRIIDRNGEINIAACGRSDTSSGTEGSFDIFEQERKVFNLYFDSPWSAFSSNDCKIRDHDHKWLVKRTIHNDGEGALGNVFIEVTEA